MKKITRALVALTAAVGLTFAAAPAASAHSGAPIQPYWVIRCDGGVCLPYIRTVSLDYDARLNCHLHFVTDRRDSLVGNFTVTYKWTKSGCW